MPLSSDRSVVSLISHWYPDRTMVILLGRLLYRVITKKLDFFEALLLENYEALLQS